MNSDQTAGECGVDDRVKRQRLLAAVLDTFPTEPLHPYGGLSDSYRRLFENRPMLELQGMFTARYSLTIRRWHKLVDDHLKRLGQNVTRWQTLFELAINKPGETLTSIAMRVGVVNARLVGLLDELEADGLIQRTVDENDRRSKVIELTPAGEEMVTSLFDVMADLRRQFLDGISEEELLLMLDAHEIMSRNLEKMIESE